MTIHIGAKALVVIAVVLALAAIGVATGVIPFAQLLWTGLVLICPLLMLFMMRDMQGDRHERS